LSLRRHAPLGLLAALAFALALWSAGLAYAAFIDSATTQGILSYEGEPPDGDGDGIADTQDICPADPDDFLGEGETPGPPAVGDGCTQDAFFRSLAEHWAPVIYQDVDSTYVDADRITNFDYDSDVTPDWRGDNNWENLDDPRFLPLEAYAYYWVVESRTHWFVGYALFHPRDWGDQLAGLPAVLCLEDGPTFPLDPGEIAAEEGACHENDMEGALLTIRRDGSQFGQFLLMNTKFHTEFLDYVDNESPPSKAIVRSSGDALDGDVRFNETRPSHPRLYVEAIGHGVSGVPRLAIGPIGVNTEPWEITGFPGTEKDGIIYLPRGVVEPPVPGDPPTEAYELKSLQEIWSRRCDPQTFFRPDRFRGDSWADNLVQPPWGWEGLGAPIDFFLDPAQVIRENFDFSGTGIFPSLSYTGASVRPGPTDLQGIIACGAGSQEPRAKRAIVYIQGITSESKCVADGAEHDGEGFLDRAPAYLNSYLTSPWIRAHATVSDIVYFSYSGRYCDGGTGENGAAPDYDPIDTCNQGIDEQYAVALEGLIERVTNKTSGSKVTIVAHSQGGLIASYLVGRLRSDKPEFVRERIASVVTFDSFPEGIPGIAIPLLEWLYQDCPDDPSEGGVPPSVNDWNAWSLTSDVPEIAKNAAQPFGQDSYRVGFYTLNAEGDLIPNNADAMPDNLTDIRGEILHETIRDADDPSGDTDHTTIWDNETRRKQELVGCAVILAWPCDFSHSPVDPVVPNGVALATIDVPEGSPKARFTSSWVGSTVRLALTTPSGPIEPLDFDPVGSYVVGVNFESYELPDPEPGTWQLELLGLDVPPEGEEVALLAEITPPLDADGDQVPDVLDFCRDTPLAASVDANGCSDFQVDGDGDGVCDLGASSTGPSSCMGVDVCPDAAEDIDGYQDEDGCPDPDNDGDGIPDESDACPNESETANSFRDSDGCPEPCTNVIIGTESRDRLVGTPQADCIDGRAGRDHIWGLAGGDIIDGGSGNDLIFGGRGNDLVDGGPGNHVILGGEGDDQLTGGAGMDLILGDGGNDVMDGGEGFDFCFGGKGVDEAANCERRYSVP
jgi:pimeloyl-ACP methyl ester carboxylesterase